MHLIWQKGEEEIVKYSANIDLSLLFSLLHLMQAEEEGLLQILAPSQLQLQAEKRIYPLPCDKKQTQESLIIIIVGVWSGR